MPNWATATGQLQLGNYNWATANYTTTECDKLLKQFTFPKYIW